MFGYRKYHGCPTALLSLTEQWKEDLDKHNIIGTIDIDLSKAFHCLSHDLILEKLKFHGLSDHALSLTRSYLSSRYQRVKLSDAFSTWQEVSRGVPQGSILGPTFFNIFMNDLAYGIKQCRIVNYADDTNIHCSNKMFVLSKTTLISILRMLLHGLFKMAWYLTQINIRLSYLAKRKTNWTVNELILKLKPQKRLVFWRLSLITS